MMAVAAELRLILVRKKEYGIPAEMQSFFVCIRWLCAVDICIFEKECTIIEFIGGSFPFCYN